MKPKDRTHGGHEVHSLIFEQPKVLIRFPWVKRTVRTMDGGQKEISADVFIYGADKKERKIIRQALRVMTPEVINCLDSIALLSSSDATREHFGFIDKDPARPIAAHCHRQEAGCICIEKNKLNKPLVWHEAAHALQLHLDPAVFWDWSSIVETFGFIFGEDRRPADQIFPCDGFVTRYGSRNTEEDIAEWVEEILAAKILGESQIFRRGLFSGDIYHRKLKFLLDYKFISEKEYKFIKPLIS